MPHDLPSDYAERVYAGVLGKIIGVYAGRPFEQWTHERIVERWGEIRRYVHVDTGHRLIAADDDLTGTFTFIRALSDHGSGAELTSQQIGQSWLNYIGEGKHILWWGGMGMSTEHTAYLRLAAGIPAPESGSITRNGRAVAEEIGAQIFIDGWAMICPNQPEQAVKFARAAGSVSHDGEAVHAAALLAAMEAMAFSEANIDTLLDRGLTFLPPDCAVARMVEAIRAWHRTDANWKLTLNRLREHYGYQHFGTNCPALPNFGIIVLALLYGGGDFGESLMIANTAGYDTDCNSGNVGCLLGIRGGLDALVDPKCNWRGLVNDRLFRPAADGHDGACDAATVAFQVIYLGRELAGHAPLRPKDGARFHFDLPGATQGFAPVVDLPDCGSAGRVRPALTADGERTLFLDPTEEGAAVAADTPVFPLPGEFRDGGYAISATPALYPGQEVRARVTAAAGGGEARLFVRGYQAGEGLRLVGGPWHELAAGATDVLHWTVPDFQGWPIATVGVGWRAKPGDPLALRWLTWTGQPQLEFAPPAEEQREVWTASFVHNADLFAPGWLAPFNLAKGRGTGIVHTGGRDWHDYEVSAELKPILGDDFGLVARVGGLTRYYGLIATVDGELRLIRACHEETVLARIAFLWPFGESHRLTLTLTGRRLSGAVDGQVLLEVEDAANRLEGGGAGWRISTGRLQSGPLRIRRVST